MFAFFTTACRSSRQKSLNIACRHGQESISLFALHSRMRSTTSQWILLHLKQPFTTPLMPC